MGGVGRRTAALAVGRRQFMCLAACLALGGVYLLPMRLGVICGESMSPTLHDGQIFVMWRVGPRSRLVKGDVVVIKVGSERYVKRVYATAGDTVSGLDWAETKGHPDYIASSQEVKRLPQLAHDRPGVGRFVRVKVPKGHVFVLGDAINRSYDSRQFGPVPVSRVCGRVITPLFRTRSSDDCAPAMARERVLHRMVQPPDGPVGPTRHGQTGAPPPPS